MKPSSVFGNCSLPGDLADRPEMHAFQRRILATCTEVPQAAKHASVAPRWFSAISSRWRAITVPSIRLGVRTVTVFVVLTLWSLVAHGGAKFATYNVGLAHGFVPLAKERLSHLTNALASSSADVLCLQEVWTKKDRESVAQALQASFPHLYATPIEVVRSDKRPVCTPGDIYFGKDKIVKCIMSKCGDVDGSDFSQCVLESCATALDKLKKRKPQCLTALMAQVDKSMWLGILTVLNPFIRASLFAYKGSNGLMLFSKHPLEDVELFDMTDVSTLNRRAALTANVQVDGRRYQALCTHPTPEHSTIPYTGDSGSWGEENKIQLTRLIESVSETGPSILMGDFNCGLASLEHGLDGELEDSCRLPLEAGFLDHLADHNPECTYCSSEYNNLNEGKDKSKLIDHIYVKGASVVSSEVVYKEKVTVTKKGEELSTNLSDHFGVLIEIE